MIEFILSLAAVIALGYFALRVASRSRKFGDIPAAMASVCTGLRDAWTQFASEFKAPWLLVAVILGFAAVILRASLLFVLLAATLLFWFASAWLREFRFLMHLSDDVFPGQNDKLIWAILLIVLPPVGLWLFQSYREAHWPETKPSSTEAHGEVG
jgi:hypothetical protein